jgi:hypothetical protein
MEWNMGLQTNTRKQIMNLALDEHKGIGRALDATRV